jgi:hypothetical protein
MNCAVQRENATILRRPPPMLTSVLQSCIAFVDYLNKVGFEVKSITINCIVKFGLAAFTSSYYGILCIIQKTVFSHMKLLIHRFVIFLQHCDEFFSRKLIHDVLSEYTHSIAAWHPCKELVLSKCCEGLALDI